MLLADRTVTPVDLPITPPAAKKETLDLRSLLLILWRQKIVIAATGVLLMALAVAVVMALRPQYTATAAVVLNARQERILHYQSVLTGLPVDPPAVQTEMQVLGSRSLATKVVNALGLDRDPEFNTALRDPAEAPWMDRLQAGVRNAIAAVAAIVSSPPADKPAGEPAGLGPIIDNFAGRLKLQVVGESRAITISFTSWDARKAAAAANMLADIYVADQLAAKREANDRANRWLSEQLVELRRGAEESRRDAQTFRDQSGLVLGDLDLPLPAREVSRLTEELVKAKAERTAAEARLEQARLAVQSGVGIDSIPEVMDSGLIRSLREQEAQLSAKMAELSQLYGRNHPNMRLTREQLQEVRRHIDAEVQRVLRALERQVEATRQAERGLTEGVDSLVGGLGEANRAQGELQVLEAEATANQAMFDAVLQRYKETTAEGSMQEPDSYIISRADVPIAPAYPKKLQILLLCLIAAGGIGIGLALLNEAFDDTIRSTDQVESLVGTPALGLVPTLRGRRWSRRGPARYVLGHRRSAFAESLRRLYSGVMISNGGAPPRSILLTSSLPAEGKTTIAVALGRLLAGPGRRVVVVDADLRRPAVHSLIGTRVAPGLVECVAGTLKVEEAVRRDPESAMFFLPAGDTGEDASRIIESERMATVLQTLARTYDLVIIDAAPVLAVNDARLISRLVDRTVYLVRWGRTRRAVAASGIKQLFDAGAQIAGVLVTRVDMRRHALYGFADSGSYRGQLARYYVG